MKSGHTATADEGKIGFTHDILKIVELSESVTGAPDSSIYISQDPHLTDQFLCTCCHEKNIPRSQCVIFKDSKYELSSEDVWNTLSARFAIASGKEYICRSCCKSLLLEKKHHKRPHRFQSVGHNCILCCSASDNKSRPFQHMTYGRNDMPTDILHGKICKEVQ